MLPIKPKKKPTPKPKKLYNVGQSLYKVWWDDETGKCEVELYIIRSIRKGRVFATKKTEFTWVKVSKKHGDYGWASYISHWDKEAFRPEAMGKLGWAPSVHLTKQEAWQAAKKEVEEWEDFEPGMPIRDRLLKTITSQITKNAPKKKK